MQLKPTFYALALLAGLGLALGACSSSSDDDPPVAEMPMEPMEPTEPAGPTAEEAKTAVTDAIAALATARAAVGPATDTLTTATSAVDTARADLAGAEPGAAQDAAIVALMMAQATQTTAQNALEAANDAVTAATTALSTARDTLAEVAPDSLALIDAQQALADAQAAATAAAEAARLAAEQAKAKAEADLAKAIEERDEARKQLADMEDAANKAKMKALHAAVRREVLGAPPYVTSETLLSAGVVKGKVTVKLGADGTTGDDLTALDPVKLANDDYETTRGAPDMMDFAKYYVDANFSGVALANGVLTLNAAVADDIKKHVESARFPESGRVQYAEDTPTATIPGSASLSGTLRGASGAFKCGGADCFISGDPVSGYTFSDGWTFTFDDNSQVVIPDEDYADWGWWAYKRPDQTIRVGTFANSTDTEVAAPAVELTGSANFEGKALGKYGVNLQPIGTDLVAGHFTATAKLSIDFGDATAAVSEVSGTIDEFVIDSERVDASTWSVSLNGDGTPSFANNNDNADAFGTTTWSIGDDEYSLVQPAGDTLSATNAPWTAGFYHDGKARNDGTPAYALGQFDALHGTNAYMTGAFQAANTAEDTPSTEE